MRDTGATEGDNPGLSEALYQATVAVGSTLDLDRILDHILEQVDHVIRRDAVNVMLIEGETACIVRARGYERHGEEVLGLSLRLSDAPILRRVQQTGEAVVIQNTESDPDWVRLPEVAWIRSCAVAPIRIRDQVVGYLSLDSATLGFFTPAHADLLCVLADHASLALSNAQLFQIVEEAKRDWEGTFDAMQDPVVLVDQGHRIMRANRAFSRLVQRRFQEIVGQELHAVVEGAACPQPLCQLEQGTRNRRSATCVHEYRGQILEIQATPVSRDVDEEAAPATHTIYALRDITEHRRVEQEIRRRNRELVLLNRIIAASVTSSAIEVFLDMVCRELVEAFERIQASATLFTEDKTTSMVVARHPESSLELLGAITTIDDDPYSIDIRGWKEPLVSQDALTDPRLFRCHTELEEQGVVSIVLLPLLVEGDVVGYLRMHTSEPRAFSRDEVDLAQRVADQVSNALTRMGLEKEQRQLHTAVEQAAEAVVITGIDGTIEYANPAFEQVTGHCGKETIGRKLAQLMGPSQDRGARVKVSQILSAGQTWKGRFVNVARDGSPYTADSTISPVRDQRGKVVNFVVTLRNVTRELELERQFQQAQKMEALGRLAGGIAHDFNNLLTVIHLSTRLLERKLEPADASLDHVRNIREAGEQAAKLTRQLLSFSRPEVNEPRALDLSQVVGDLSKMLHRIIGEDITLVTQLADALWPIRIDPAQIEQVVMNLVVNARDAMPCGGTLTIETKNVTLSQAYATSYVNVQPGDHVLLMVHDTGQGMSIEVRAHLFEPFFTTKEEGRGTGLGLSTVFGIVSRIGGHIQVESQVGWGTTFKIYLPRDKEVKTRPTDQVLRSSGEPASRGQETVLVVEDDASVRHLAVRVLKSHGYRALEAGNGLEALQICGQQSGPLHLVLTDVVMPLMNGMELAERLRDQQPELAVLYMSGYADGAIPQQGELPANTAFLSKPFTVETLIQKVRALLSGQVG
ncbi:MAG TPA: GAF domain-containing protein [Anaerolineae bacterium]|nr:GAF domain-containing protein [Anaerolineae bacterium]